MDVSHIEQNVDGAAGLLKAMSNESRLRIVCTLYRGEKSVRELEAVVGLSQSALSQHLSLLRENGIVTARRDAQNVYYSLNDRRITQILIALGRFYRVGITPE